MELSNISAVSYTNSIIPGVNNTTVFRTPGGEDDHLMGTYLADYEHLDALAISIKEGRNFSRDFSSDSSAVLVNEATVVEMGWDNPIGEKLWRFGEDEEGSPWIPLHVDRGYGSSESTVTVTTIASTINSLTTSPRSQ